MSVGLTIGTIREALAEQIDNYLERDSNVYARPVGDVQYPAITVGYGTGDFITYWETFGERGISSMRFVLTVETAGMDAESASIALDDYLSVGTGNGSSLVDAVHSDPTLGGVVAASVIRSVAVDPITLTAELEVEIHTNKVGAEA